MKQKKREKDSGEKAIIVEDSVMDNREPKVSPGRKVEIIQDEDPYTGYKEDYTDWN